VHSTLRDRSAVVTTILIADSHAVVRSGLRALLSQRPGWQVVGEAADGKEAVEQAIKTTPDVAIVDYSLPILNGADVTKRIRMGSPATEVLIFTMRDDSSVVQDVLRAGAKGYLLKSDDTNLLIAAVETIAAHKPLFTGVVSAALLRSFLSKGHADALTARERSVVQLVAEGHTNKKIASILNLGVKAVETIRAGAHHKLRLHSTAGLVRYAVRNNMVSA
jgi:DNA-binding NarL/FixJ family response regulator